MSSRHHHPSMGLSASCSPAALLHPRWPPFPRPVPRGPRSLQPLPFQAWGLSWGFIRAEARVLCFALGLLSFFLTFIAEEALFQLFNHARRKHTIPVRPHLALGVCAPAELCLRAERPSCLLPPSDGGLEGRGPFSGEDRGESSVCWRRGECGAEQWDPSYALYEMGRSHL